MTEIVVRFHKFRMKFYGVAKGALGGVQIAQIIEGTTQRIVEAGFAGMPPNQVEAKVPAAGSIAACQQLFGTGNRVGQDRSRNFIGRKRLVYTNGIVRR